ncbi:MAG: hypothetical protein LUM44_04715 [Pyrinomonadaceae bacterium]|nr:hypothetical protein [Pyrinomonadaceae bacterium]
MMNAIFLRGLNEYKRQTEMQKSFEKQTERVDSILRKVEDSDRLNENERCRMSLLLLMPLVEVAWSDGRISRREMDVIVKAADVYGLVDSVGGYRELIERLLTRPAPQTTGRMWQDFHDFLSKLNEDERRTLNFCVLAQAKFVAEQSSDSVIAFLRGERISEDEQNTLRAIAEQLKTANAAVEKRPETILEESANKQSPAVKLDDENLIPLVPLVKTAWAEGRVTKRERHLIFEAAARMGIKPNTASYKRLSEWLELHPTDEFYEYALGKLTQSWKNLDADEKKERKSALLSECTKIAEASGGSKDFPAGGMRICEEEIAVVKRIAKRIGAADVV